MKSGSRTVAVATCSRARWGFRAERAGGPCGGHRDHRVKHPGRSTRASRSWSARRRRCGRPVTFNIALPVRTAPCRPLRYTAHPFIYRGIPKTAAESADNYIGPGIYTCFETERRSTPGARATFHIDPHPSRKQVNSNPDATTWKTAVALRLVEGQRRPQDRGVRDPVQDRAAQARGQGDRRRHPGAGHKDKKITVTGKLTPANWSTKKYGGYSGRNAQLPVPRLGRHLLQIRSRRSPPAPPAP